MPTGKVKWFDPQKGFGFIVPDGGGSDVFVHHSGLAEEGKPIVEGQAVQYEVESTPRGSKAVAVRPVAE